MTKRITKKDFLFEVERLEHLLKRKLESNIWHNHYSVYTATDNGGNDELLISASTAREAVEHIQTIRRVLYVVK